MTSRQLALGDCDPDWERLCDEGAEQLHAPAEKPHRDLRGQRISVTEQYRVADVQVVGDWL